MTNLTHNFYLFLSLFILLLLFGILSDFIIKAIKSLFTISKTSINYFIIYHLYYKEKLRISEIYKSLK